MAGTATTKHPFGELLAQYRARRPGLTQTRLAELTGYDQAILTRMVQGKKDLTGPSGRERIMRIIETLLDQNAILTLDEANALLLAADLPPLFERQPAEAKLITRIGKTPAGLRTRRTNLPALVSSFIGRNEEIAAVRSLLNAARLVTLTGSGGCGKTRLAQRVAGDVLLLYPDGVWYVELAALTDESMIADAAVRALGLVMADQPALERLTEHLRERHALLVLDNCEHLIDSVAAFAIAVLQSCPRITIVTTSREALNVDGERAWHVPPMQPDDASRLFVERAASQNALSAGDKTVAHICQRLDGMPLAIELAASRLQVMGLNDVAARLDDRFNLLTQGRRGALPRHQTLRAMIDWSHQLLSEDEQIAFRRLGVFVGGWEIDLAESLIGNDALALLTQMVNKSLVVVDEADGHLRYRFLETIREYALEKLREAGELEAARHRQAEAIAELAERAEKPMRGPQQKQWLDRIARDLANLEAALSWCFGPNGDALMGCRIVSVLKIVWLSSPATLSAERWITAALAVMTDDMPARVRAALQNVHASIYMGGESSESVAGYEIALRLYEEVGDSVGVADMLFNLASVRLFVNSNDAAAWHDLRASISLAEEAGDILVAHCAMLSLADIKQHAMQFEEAEFVFRDLCNRSRSKNDLANLTKAQFRLGLVLHEQLRFDESQVCFEVAVDVACQINSPVDEMFGLGGLAEAMRFQGNVKSALDVNDRAMELAFSRLNFYHQNYPIVWVARAFNYIALPQNALELLVDRLAALMHSAANNLFFYVELFDAMACALILLGDAKCGAQLFGCADALIQHGRRYLHNDWEYAPYIAKAHALTSKFAFDAWRAEGQQMSLERALATALNAGKLAQS